MAARNALTIASVIKLNSGFEIPLLGFGVYQSTDALASCKVALQAGYLHIDSARAYRNEEAVAKAVQDSGIDRSSLFLTTKVTSREHGYDTCSKAVEDSFQKLDGPWDLILLHDPLAGKEKRLEAYKALVDAQKAGKTRTIGVSNYNVHHLEELVAAKLGPLPAINQVELHPWCQQKPIVDWCQRHGVVVQAYSPLTRGQYFSDPTLTSICKRYNKTPAQVLVRWSLQRGFIPLPKSDTPERIRENANVYDFEIDAEGMKQLDALDKGDAGGVTWNPVNAA